MLSMLLLYTAIFAAVVSLLLRLRHATGVERQQLKWFTYGGVLVGVFLLSEFLPPFPGVWESLKEALAFNLLPPLTIGLAVLRYRLYDIDLLIRRTLVYTVLTASLVLVYFSSVIGLQSLIHAFSGPARHPLVTVLSTLAIAALFTPLRRRIQEGIDRRFYRRKYNVEQVLTTFGASVRNETNLEQLCAVLASVIQETLQPASLHVWLNPVPNRSPSLATAEEKCGAVQAKV
jgi:hypothetical protein